MEDAATAEISRAQTWQWISQAARLDDGRTVTPDLFRPCSGRDGGAEATLAAPLRNRPLRRGDQALLPHEPFADFEEFLTLPAYEVLA